MSKLDSKSIVLTLLTIVVVFLVVERRAPALPYGGSTDADRGMIAVTGTYGSGVSALYLIDTKTRHLAAYRIENGRHLELLAARDCTYDFLLDTYNDESAPSMLPASLKKSWAEFNAKGGVTPPIKPEAEKTAAGAKSPTEAGTTPLEGEKGKDD